MIVIRRGVSGRHGPVQQLQADGLFPFTARRAQTKVCFSIELSQHHGCSVMVQVLEGLRGGQQLLVQGGFAYQMGAGEDHQLLMQVLCDQVIQIAFNSTNLISLLK